MSLLLLLLFCHVSSAVKHSLRSYFTASSGVRNLPEVVAVALVNDVQTGYCDSKLKTAIPTQAWMEKLIDGDPQYWRSYTESCTMYQQAFKEEFNLLKKRLNKTGGVHILQKMHGCDWDDETGEVHGYQQYGYNGDDFLTFDSNTDTWIASKPQAVITKHFWDRQRDKNKFWKDFFTQTFPDWLRKHLNYGKSFLLRTDLPSVSLLQKSPSSAVSCHATGFYPDRAMMFWRKDGEEIHEDVDVGEIRPNHDGSFQMSVDLNVSSVAPEAWSRYECVFHLTGVKDDIITKLDKAAIRTNWVSPSEFPAVAVVGVVVGLLLLTLGIAGLFIWRRNNQGFRPANR
ncbi:major histocompatibility complex class I-related gene protein-like [Plectropomus leopardus]|uniref:major histocompatibility complex class I-related gene protein-like n=1 Tax=Plectropomus leopardus TaxID=160734 RepID=UPI001C4A8383|nr:major histocompatibility complex class I-related gene protein-like [Plectropomus leopardus]